MPYNEEGRYFDEKIGVVYHEQAQEVYGFISTALLLIVILLLRWILKTRKLNSGI